MGESSRSPALDVTYTQTWADIYPRGSKGWPGALGVKLKNGKRTSKPDSHLSKSTSIYLFCLPALSLIFKVFWNNFRSIVELQDKMESCPESFTQFPLMLASYISMVYFCARHSLGAADNIY